MIREFDFRMLIIAHSGGLIVDGHLRLQTAPLLGLSEAQLKAFRLAVNRMAEGDDKLLALEFADLG
ncbi:hypothetical protein METHB2_960001 [Candidatus Methylobacter favarea]|uniref:Uncharacterized protein n=1 Tax=Candidatus Methylobacter favarea TaxID=2707345 RepID=A0A8S0XW75_9GAMM|nr:hypothetical protein [Candidatus Methylobacter favarea]CAA9893038.1 hypothetical protein METHB2_960001 [Candidatus Methylobacter favarea]